MRVTIGFTGTNGFLAKSIKKRLDENFYNIIDLDPVARNLLSRPTNISDIYQNLNWIFHFGAKTSIEKSIKDPFEVYFNNFKSTLSIVELAKLTNSKILFLSSYIYGKPKYFPVDEHHPIKPTNPYMESKWISEQVCSNISAQLGIPLIIFRLFNVYGPGMNEGRLIIDLINNVINNETLILNDPNPKRDYLYIRDLEDLIYKILGMNTFKKRVYNIGGGRAYSNLEVARKILNISKKRLKIKILNIKRKNDVDICFSNNNKVNLDLKWTPSFNLDQGLSEILNFKKYKL